MTPGPTPRSSRNSDPTCAALLGLNGTVYTPKTRLTVGPRGTVDTRITGASGGLDIPATATVAITGTVSIIFEQDPAASGLYYGLRWEGNHVADLEALHAAGGLVWDDTALLEPVSIFAKDGFTYVGQAASLATISAFTVADASTGSTLVTNDATVNVSITAEPAEGHTIDGYAVTETANPPTTWLPAISSYAITGPEGSVTLYAWAKDTAGNTASKSAAICFSTVAPVVSDLVITDNGDTTATATWTTDILAEGSVNYGPVAMSGSTPNTSTETALGTSHSIVITGIVDGTNCKLVIVNNEHVGPTAYWPKPWPIEGDANMDCRVNILDLIFIRNKLNLDVGTDDNWKARRQPGHADQYPRPDLRAQQAEHPVPLTEGNRVSRLRLASEAT